MKQLLLLALVSVVLFSSCRDEDGPATPIPAKPDTTVENKPPYDILLSNTVFEEKYEAGYQIGEFSALDPNSADEHQFLFVNGPGSADNDLFEIKKNTLHAKESFLYGPKNTFNIRVWTTDGEFEFEKNFQINLIPFVPEAPVVTSVHFLTDSLMPAFVGFDSTNINPQIEINNIPRLTNYLVITMRDLDASNAWHWSAWNIPVEKDTLFDGENWQGYSSVVVGDSDFGKGYQGPNPPAKHMYEFTVYCLTDTITLIPSQYTMVPSEAIKKSLITGTLRGSYEP